MEYHITPEDLYTDLFIAYHKAIRHKSRKHYVKTFSKNLESNLRELAKELLERRYTPRPSTCFIVNYPKKREVFAADFRDRIVHHYIFMKTHKLFERTFVADSYSCIERRGTHYGIQRLEHHIRSCSENYTRHCHVLKMDIRGYFMHIDRHLLSDMTEQILRKMAMKQSTLKGKRWCEVMDIEFIIYLCREVISVEPTHDCIINGNATDWIGLPYSKSMFNVTEGYGMPIGNLTSQLFSNVFLGDFDQYMKRTLKCRHYGRYVDDFFVVSTEREWLHQVARQADEYLRNRLHLEVNRGKTHIVNVRYGVEFLGAYIKPFRTYISNASLRRMFAQLPNLRNKGEERIFDSVNSYLGVLIHYRSYNIRRELIGRIDLTKAKASVNSDYGKAVKW